MQTKLAELVVMSIVWDCLRLKRRSHQEEEKPQRDRHSRPQLPTLSS